MKKFTKIATALLAISMGVLPAASCGKTEVAN